MGDKNDLGAVMKHRMSRDDRVEFAALVNESRPRSCLITNLCSTSTGLGLLCPVFSCTSDGDKSHGLRFSLPIFPFLLAVVLDGVLFLPGLLPILVFLSSCVEIIYSLFFFILLFLLSLLLLQLVMVLEVGICSLLV